jgi:hypothetical protein
VQFIADSFHLFSNLSKDFLWRPSMGGPVGFPKWNLPSGSNLRDKPEWTCQVGG